MINKVTGVSLVFIAHEAAESGGRAHQAPHDHRHQQERAAHRRRAHEQHELVRHLQFSAFFLWIPDKGCGLFANFSAAVSNLEVRGVLILQFFLSKISLFPPCVSITALGSLPLSRAATKPRRPVRGRRARTEGPP